MAPMPRRRRRWPPATRRAVPVLILATTVPAGACGGDSPLPLLVRVSEPDPAPALEMEEMVRLGGLEVEEPYLFSTLGDVVRDREGNYYVADQVAAEVRVFDREGAYLRRFGGKGEGPGELLRIDDLVLDGDRIAVVNRRRGGSVVVFTTEGELVEDWRTTRTDRVQLLPVGAREGAWLVERIPAPTPILLEDGDTLEIHHSLHPLTEVRDSVGEELVRWVGEVWFGSEALLGPDRLKPLFRHREIVAADGHGILYRSPGFPYRVEVLDSAGAAARTVGREVEPVLIGERDYRALEDELMLLVDTTTEVPDIVKVVAKPLLRGELERRWEVPHAAERTVVGAVLPAEDGSVWVERRDHIPPAEAGEAGLFRTESREETRWELFGPSGTFLGGVVLSPTFRGTHATATTLTGVEKDHFDLEYVVTYRVTLAGES